MLSEETRKIRSRSAGPSRGERERLQISVVSVEGKDVT